MVAGCVAWSRPAGCDKLALSKRKTESRDCIAWCFVGLAFSSYLSYRPHGRYLVMVLRDPSLCIGMTASRCVRPVIALLGVLLGRHIGLPLRVGIAFSQYNRYPFACYGLINLLWPKQPKDKQNILFIRCGGENIDSFYYLRAQISHMR